MYALRELILWTISGFSRSLHRPVDPLRHYYVQSQNKGELSHQCTSFQTKLSIKPLQLTKNKGQGKKKNCKTWKKKQQQQQPNKQEANRKKIDKYQKCVLESVRLSKLCEYDLASFQYYYLLSLG